jgi:hypothetical protein
MPDPQLLLLAEELRARADEILARAESFHDAGARQTMHKIAADYERLADRLEGGARSAAD